MSDKYNIIPMDEPGLFSVNGTTTSYIVHIATGSFYDKEQVLLELCRAIVALERRGGHCHLGSGTERGRTSSSGRFPAKQTIPEGQGGETGRNHCRHVLYALDFWCVPEV